MARFINIAADDKKPVLVNIDDIAVVEEALPGHALGQTQHSIRIVGMDGRDKAHLDCAAWNVDVDVVVKKLTAAGLELVAMDATWPKDGGIQKTGRYFVNPAAFQYVITSKPAVAKGETEETSAVLLSMRGYFVETYATKLPVIDELLTKVDRALPQLKHVDVNRMTARFYQMGRIAYNPAAIVGINTGSDRVDVRFAGATIDFNAPRRDWCNFYLDKRCNKASAAKRDVFMRTVWNNPAVDTQAHIYGFENKIRNRLGREFARVVAADVPELIKVNSDYGPVYNRFQDVSMMSLSDDRDGKYTYLRIRFAKGNEDGITATFNSRDKAEEEMHRLAGLLAAPKP